MKILVLPVVAALVLPAAASASAEPRALMPHRAVYDLTLDRLSAKSSVELAQGRIVFEFGGSACDGYTMSLRQVVELATDNGRRSVSDTRSTSWEDGDGRAFRFATQSFIDRNPQDNTEGRAERAVTGGVTVKIARPQEGQADLGQGVVFPTEHLRRILAAAREGQSILSVKVFDGTESGRKVYDTMSVIGRPIVTEAVDGFEPAARKGELKGVRRWPVTISYFEAGSGEQTPLYTIQFELFETGLSRDLVLDYGDFKLKGEIASLEFSAASPCR